MRGQRAVANSPLETVSYSLVERGWKTQYSWPWSFPDRQPVPRLVGNFQYFPPENGGHAKFSPRSNYFCNLQTLIEETKHVTIDELGWKATIHIPLLPFCVFSPLPHSLLQSPSHIIRHLFSIFLIRFLLCLLIPPHCASVRRVYFFLNRKLSFTSLLCQTFVSSLNRSTIIAKISMIFFNCLYLNTPWGIKCHFPLKRK